MWEQNFLDAALGVNNQLLDSLRRFDVFYAHPLKVINLICIAIMS